MTCYLCRETAPTHLIRSLRTGLGPRGWCRICIPCAIFHDLDGVLLSPPRDQELANRWLDHQERRRARRRDDGRLHD